MSDEENGSSGSEEEGSASEEEEVEEKMGLTKEALDEDIATLFDIAKYIDNTKHRISARLCANNRDPKLETAPVPPPVPDFVTSSAYDSVEERQRAMLLDKAIMVLMNDGGGKS